MFKSVVTCGNLRTMTKYLKLTKNLAMHTIMVLQQQLPIYVKDTEALILKNWLKKVRKGLMLRDNCFAQRLPDINSTIEYMRYFSPFAQIKTCEKHPWRSATFSKVY